MRSWISFLALLSLTAAFYWKLTFTGQYIWFDHSDVVHLELPRLQYQAREIQAGRFPLWDPNIWCGQPLIGQTQPGPLFPLNLLLCLVPLRDGHLRVEWLNWYYVFAHFLGAWFCYLLARELQLRRAAAVLAGCAFAFGGFLGTAPWPDVYHGALWTPLVFLYVLRAVRGHHRLASSALAGLFLGVAWLSGHHEIPILATAAAALTWAWYALRDRSLLRHAALSLVIAGLVSAVQLWPTVEFGRRSVRWVGASEPAGWADRVPYTIDAIYSAPFRAFVETALPSNNTYADTSPFLGITVTLLALLGLTRRWDDARVRWLAVLTALSALYAAGAFSFLHGIVYSLVPLVAKARVPVRAFHLYNLGLALLAGFGLHYLTRPSRMKWAALASSAVILAAAVAAQILGHPVDDRIWLAGFCALVAAAVFHRPHPTYTPAILLVLILTELTNLAPRNFPHLKEGNQIKFAQNLTRHDDIAAYLRAQPGHVRVAVLEESIPENFGDLYGIEMHEGYVAGVPLNVYRADRFPAPAQQLLGITHVLGRTPARPDQTLVFTSASGVNVYANPGAFPHAWSEHSPPCEGNHVRITRHHPDRVTMDANLACRGTVMLSDTYYPGWRATVDGRRAVIRELHGFLRGVDVEAGVHTIDMVYRPVSVFGGAALTLLGFLLTAGCLLYTRKS